MATSRKEKQNLSEEALTLLGKASILSRKEKLFLAMSLAGQLGAQLQFPSVTIKSSKEDKKEKPSKQKPGQEKARPHSKEEEEYKALKAKVSKAKKAKLPLSQELLKDLEEKKLSYFRSSGKILKKRPEEKSSVELVPAASIEGQEQVSTSPIGEEETKWISPKRFKLPIDDAFAVGRGKP